MMAGHADLADGAAMQQSASTRSTSWRSRRSARGHSNTGQRPRRGEVTTFTDPELKKMREAIKALKDKDQDPGRRGERSELAKRKGSRPAGGRVVLPPRRSSTRCSCSCSSASPSKVPVFPFHTWLPDAHVEHRRRSA